MSTNNNSNMNISTNGSMTRMTIGAVEQPQSLTAPAEYQPNRVASGVTKLTIGSSGTNSIEQSGVTRHQTYNQRSSDSVMGTLERVNGKDTVELIPGNAASRTGIQQAFKDGLITPIGNGHWANASEGRNSGYQPTQQQQNQQATSGSATGDNTTEQLQSDPGAGIFNPAEDAEWAEWIEPLPQFAFDGAAAGVTAAVLAGDEGFERAAAQLAEQAGIEPELANEYVQAGYDMHERLVAKEAAAMGVTDKAGFYSWLRESKAQALHRAVQSLSASRDIQPWRVLALEYTRFTSDQATKLRPR